MATKLNDLKYSVWLFFGRILDRPSLAFINELVRRVYLGPVADLVSRRMNQVAPGCSVNLRHSARTGFAFNPFFSDLDITVVVREGATEADFENLRQVYSGLRSKLPFLCELEIFTVLEDVRFKELVHRAPGLFELMHTVRKISWLLGDAENAKSAYHEYKAERALEVLSLKALGRVESPRVLLGLLSERFKTLMPRFPAALIDSSTPRVDEVECNHLQWNPQTDLGLPVTKSWALLAILPSSGKVPAAQTLLGQIRAVRTLGYLHTTYLEAEAIQIEAVYRARRTEFPWMADWARELRRRIVELTVETPSSFAEASARI